MMVHPAQVSLKQGELEFPTSLGYKGKPKLEKTTIDSLENTCNPCKVFLGGFKSHTQNQDVKYVVGV